MPGSGDPDEPTQAQLQRRILESQIEERHRRLRLAERGQIMAFALSLAFLAAAVWSIAIGHSWAGTVLGTVDIVALVSVFITGRSVPPAGPGPG